MCNSYCTFHLNISKKIELKGKAFFDVTHDESSPFVVYTEYSKTTVLGTTFNVNASSAITQVSLFEGKVAFDVENNETVILAPGEKVSFDSYDVMIEKETVDDENAIAWKTNTLSFKNQDLAEVVITLESYFDKKIELSLLSKETCLFTLWRLEGIEIPNPFGVRANFGHLKFPIGSI